MRILRFPWYPIALGLYPVLALLAVNITQVRFSVLWAPLGIALLAGVIFFFILRGLVRDWHRAALILALWLILFYSYGHIYMSARNWHLFGITLGRHILMLPIWIILFGLAFFLGRLKQADFRPYALAFNVVSLVLLAFPLVRIVSSLTLASRSSTVKTGSLQELHIPVGQEKPDIYYIILDSYGRSDLLQSAYGYDNSEFNNYLQQMGFFVAGCSQSNYAHTQVSLASSLNMDYLQDLSNQFVPSSTDYSPLWKLIKHGTVRKLLEDAGYQTVAFATGFTWTEWTDANYYLSPRQSLFHLNDFEELLIQTTLARSLQDLSILRANQATAENYRQRTLLVLNNLRDLSHIQGPKLVFVHLIPPHPPFVFGPNGELLSLEEYPSTAGRYSDADYSKGYLDQVTYINHQMETVLAAILSTSSTPPIIVIQGDHGPWNRPPSEQLQILNAYYLPGHSNALYPAITPVNTFRVIFNNYFGTTYPLLQDVSYYSPYTAYYDFAEVPNPCTAP